VTRESHHQCRQHGRRMSVTGAMAFPVQVEVNLKKSTQKSRRSDGLSPGGGRSSRKISLCRLHFEFMTAAVASPS
jgi:hypothetical protein